MLKGKNIFNIFNFICLERERVRENWSKIHLLQATYIPVVTYECESWTIKKAEHQRIGAFELWCWRRLLRVP